MPARRTKLKLMEPHIRAVAVARDAEAGGVGLDFDRVPPGLDAAGRAAWEHLQVTFARNPTRFREGDRAAVAAFCMSQALIDRAAAELLAEGLRTAGPGLVAVVSACPDQR